ncbi:MAG: class I SAM-dependent methyltransferase [Anaerolineales bacterium]|nr:class I SAM-dependent methyltransferase [Anaerolineales bacterium]
MSQQTIDAKNAEFWNELCGTWLARTLGITDVSPETLRRFDEAYLAFYPYLEKYVTKQNLKGKKVLEIGLGYGTLGQFLAQQDSDYYGLDIAQGPVDMMRYRLTQLGRQSSYKVQLGSALDIPYPDESFDYVYSIGCLHHTGNLGKAVSEVYRVLIPGGKAIVMLYNQHSFRQLVTIPLTRLRSLFVADGRTFAEHIRAMYDMNSGGEAAPFTEYVSQTKVKHLFQSFSQIKIDIQNFDTYILFRGRVIIPREKLLNNLARLIGLDLYITATK